MKVASIDIGSNTVLLLIAEVNLEDKKLLPLLNLYRMPRISKGMNKSGIISKIAIKDLLVVLREYKSIIEKNNCSEVFINATQALRVAVNGEEITALIKSELDFDVKIISGDDEAYLSFLGALSGSKLSGSAIMIDIGGASTEIVLGHEDKIIYKKSFPIGVVTLTENYLQPPVTDRALEKTKDHISEIFADLKTIESNNAYVIAVAGTPTTLACAKQNLKHYSENKVEGFELHLEDLDHYISSFKSMTAKDILVKYGGIIKGREDIILAGTLILKTVIALLEKENLYSSGRGLRYGAILDYMNSINKE